MTAMLLRNFVRLLVSLSIVAGVASAESSGALTYASPREVSEFRKYRLTEFPESFTVRDGRTTFEDSEGRTILLTLDPQLQSQAEEMLKKYRPPYGAIVAIDPSTGRLLAASGSSRFGIKGEDLLGRATFPAASLFKVITGAAAVERARMTSSSLVRFRGGDHTLNQWNYLPDPRLDKRSMTLADAMGKSCNAVFARVALQNLKDVHLKEFAERFGFNESLRSDFPIQTSQFDYGSGLYDYARTAAGFRGAKVSPIHAAVISAAVANGGELLRPYLIDEVRSGEGKVLYGSARESLGRAISGATALELREMMKETTLTGTARRHFKRSSLFRTIPVAGKTGTLSGDNPEGLYHWFIGFAPIEKPEIAVATMTIDRGGSRISASALASLLLERHFAGRYGITPTRIEDQPRIQKRRSQEVKKVQKKYGKQYKKQRAKRVNKVRGRA